MKNFKFILSASLLFLLLISCKDKSSETFPREVFTGDIRGTVMNSAPDEKSGIAGIIPFGEKIFITENSDKIINNSTLPKWYKTEWNGKTGWVKGVSAGNIDTVSAQIKKSFDDQKSSFAENIVKDFGTGDIKINETYTYSGGEMEPANMFFLSNGIMVVNSKIFSEECSNTFFKYEFMNDAKLIKIIFIDSKLKFSDFAEMESSSKSIFKIDANEQSIIYHIKDKTFFFFNWGFRKIYNQF